ncbi:hypothetical protein [Aureibacter tunicatorum]
MTSVLTKNSYAYIILNLIGSFLACTASIMMQYIPFVILEGVWALASLYAFIRKIFSAQDSSKTNP